MSNIFKFHRRTNSGGPSLIAWSTKAIGDGDAVHGYKAGTIKNGSNIQYSLIACPRSNGQATTADLIKAFNTTNDVVPAALSALGNGTTNPNGNIAGQFYGSLWDGLSNTNALYSANPTNNLAVAYCKSLTTGGYNDWYLPAKDELELCYRSFKPSITTNTANVLCIGGNNSSSVPQYTQYYTSGDPAQTTVAVFQSGGSEAFSDTNYYWSSCESSDTQAWNQYFSNGFTAGNRDRTGVVIMVRPVRRSIL